MNEKHIYRIYADISQKLHVEKLTIVYSNREFIYFKVPGKAPLDYVFRNAVSTYEEWKNHKHNLTFGLSSYVLESDLDIDDVRLQFKQIVIDDKYRRICQAKDEVLSVWNKYEQALKDYNDSMEDKDKLENVYKSENPEFAHLANSIAEMIDLAKNKH